MKIYETRLERITIKKK